MIELVRALFPTSISQVLEIQTEVLETSKVDANEALYAEGLNPTFYRHPSNILCLSGISIPHLNTK